MYMLVPMRRDGNILHLFISLANQRNVGEYTRTLLNNDKTQNRQQCYHYYECTIISHRMHRIYDGTITGIYTRMYQTLRGIEEYFATLHFSHLHY